MPAAQVRKNRRQNLGMVEAIHRAGGQVKLAELLKTKQSNISKMLNHQPSHQQALAVAEVMGVPRGLLRPDIWGHELEPEVRRIAEGGVLFRQTTYTHRAA